MTTPPAPLEKAVEEARKALAVYDRDMSTFGAIQCVLALRSLLAALDADRGEAEAETELRRCGNAANAPDPRDGCRAVRAIVRTYFARREEKGEKP